MTQTTEDSFLDSIIADVADDAPRLIYADWLDDHGDPDRAEFIRLQCALAKLTASVEGHFVEWQPADQLKGIKEFNCTALVRRDAPLPEVVTLRHQQRDDSWIRFQHLTPMRVEEFDLERVKVLFHQSAQKKREQELLMAHGLEWIPPLEGLKVCAAPGSPWNIGWLHQFDEENSVHYSVEFSRGFISRVLLPEALWLQHGPKLRLPLEHVRLADKRPLPHNNLYESFTTGEDEDELANSYPWSWTRLRRGVEGFETDGPDQIDWAIWDFLEAPANTAGDIVLARRYLNEEDAFAALSRACIRHAKENRP